MPCWLDFAATGRPGKSSKRRAKAELVERADVLGIASTPAVLARAKRVGSCAQPVLDAQRWNALEFARVRGDECQVGGQGMCRDQQVVRADGCALLREVVTRFCVALICRRLQRQYLQCG